MKKLLFFSLLFLGNQNFTMRKASTSGVKTPSPKPKQATPTIESLVNEFEQEVKAVQFNTDTINGINATRLLQIAAGEVKPEQHEQENEAVTQAKNEQRWVQFAGPDRNISQYAISFWLMKLTRKILSHNQSDISSRTTTTQTITTLLWLQNNPIRFHADWQYTRNNAEGFNHKDAYVALRIIKIKIKEMVDESSNPNDTVLSETLNKLNEQIIEKIKLYEQYIDRPNIERSSLECAARSRVFLI